MPFIELESVDSTNNYARRLMNEGLAIDGTAVFAHEQWAGKGQRGNNWLTGKSANIIMSILAKPVGLTIGDQLGLNAVTAVTAHHFFNEQTNGYCYIKWPNDIYWQDRKAGGILIENTIRGDAGSALWDWAIVGIGLNINQDIFSPVLRNPVSLRQITGRTYEPVTLAKDLFVKWKENFKEFLGKGSKGFFETYNNFLYKKGETVRFKKNSRVFEALVKGVSEQGKLIVQHSIEEEFGLGEVEWLLTSTT